MLSFEVETNDNNGLQLYWRNCHIHCAICSYSGSIWVCTFPSSNFEAWSLTNTFTNAKLCVIILHDNAHPHIATSVTAVFQKYCWEVLNYTSFIPDLSPPDYNLFSKVKELLRGICFSDLSEPSSALSREIQWLNKIHLSGHVQDTHW